MLKRRGTWEASGIRKSWESHSFDVGHPNVPRFEVGRDGAQPSDMIVEINLVIDQGEEDYQRSIDDECSGRVTPFCLEHHIRHAHRQS